MTIGEKEIESMVFHALLEELEDISTTCGEAVQRIKEYMEQENLQ